MARTTENTIIKFATEGISTVFRDMESIRREQIKLANDASKANKEMAKQGDKVSKGAKEAARQLNMTARESMRSSARMITDNARIAKSLRDVVSQENALKMMRLQIRLEREKAAAQAARDASRERQQQNTIKISTEQLARAYARLAVEREKSSRAGGGGGGVAPPGGGIATGGIGAGGGSKATLDMGKAAAFLGSKLLWLAGIAVTASLALGKAGLSGALALAKTALTVLVSPLVLATRWMGNFVSRVLAVATGVLIRDVIFGIVRAIKQLSSTVVESAGAFQTLQIRLTNLISRELRTADATMSVADAMVNANTHATRLSEQLKSLSLRVPFDTQAISNTQAFAMAMGFSTNEATNLTSAVLNYAAAMGLGGEVTERIIFNFGQMVQQGKVTSTEMRDLARGAFFPLSLVLQEVQSMMGETAGSFQEVRKAAAEGKIPVQLFIKAFENVVARDFPNAAKAMARTFDGLKTRIGNFFKTVLGGDVIGPVLADFSERLSDLFDKNVTNLLRSKAKFIGQVLRRGFEEVVGAISGQLLPALANLAKAFGLPVPSAMGLGNAIAFVSVAIRRAIERLATFIGGVTANLDTNLAQVATNLYNWGYKLVSVFAKGMATAINLVVLVINAISRIITAFFSTHSPPKIAKDIDKWGAETMTEWIKGWLKADFTLFNDIADKIESFMRSIPGGIGKDNIGLVPAILGARDVVIKSINAVKNGMQTVKEAIDGVMQKVKKITPEFRDYISALFQAADAEKKLADATRIAEALQSDLEAARERTKASQEEVNKVEEKYSAILDELNKKLEVATEVYDEQHRIKEIDNALAIGRLTMAERERLEQEKLGIQIRQQIRSTEEQRDAAVKAAEDKVKAREQEEKAIEDQIRVAEAQQAAAQKELDLIQERLAAAEATIDFQIKQNDLIQEQIELMKRLAEAAKGGGEEGIPGIEDLLGGGGLDRADQAWADRLQGLADEFQKSQIDKMFDNITKSVEDFEKKMTNFSTSLLPLTGKGGALSALADALRNIQGALGGGGGIGKTGMPPERGKSPFEKLAAALPNLASALERLGSKAVTSGIDAVVNFINNVDWDKVADAINNVADAINGISDSGFKDWAETSFAEQGPIQEAIINLNNLAEKANMIRDNLFQIGLGMLSRAAEPFGFLAGRIAEWIATAFNDLIEGIPVEIDRFSEIIKTRWDIFLGALKGINKDNFQKMWDDIKQWGQDTWDSIKTTIGNWWDSFVQFFKDLIGNSLIPEQMQAIFDTITGWLQDVADWINTNFIDPVEKAWQAFSTFLIGEDGVITKFAKGVYDTVTGWIGDLNTELQTLLWGEPDGLVAKFSSAIEEVRSFFSPTGPLATAINWFKTNIIKPLADALQGIIDAYNRVRGIDNNPKTTGQEQLGGQVRGGGTYLVGEVGPELFVPPMPGGSIIPTGLTNRIIRALQQRVGATVAAAPMYYGGNTVNNYYNIEMNPNYATVQSEASVYYDLLSALSSVRR